MSTPFDKLYAPPAYIDRDGDLRAGIDKETVAWIRTNVDRSKSYLRANRGWKDSDLCMAIYYGDNVQKRPLGLSKVRVKKLRRQAREAIANAANIRPRWSHKSYRDEYEDQAKLYDLLRDDWWYNGNTVEKLKTTLQFAAGGCQGYLWLWPDFDPATGELEIIPTPLSWKDVLPFFAGPNSTMDSLYAVCVHLEMPVPEAHERFPKHIGVIQADRNTPSSFSRNWKRVQKVWRGAVDRLRGSQQSSSMDNAIPVSDIFFTWVRDGSINTTGELLYLGELGSHYAYVVPSLYGKDGNLNRIDGSGRVLSVDDDGYDQAKDLTVKECKLFPYKRLIVSTNIGVIYDGPPYYINRYNPIIPFTFEKIAGEFLGLNLINDGRPVEESTNNMLQAMEDSVTGKIQPPVGLDKNVPADIRNKLKKNSRLLQGKVFEYDTRILQKAIVALIPPEYYNLDGRAIELIKFFQDMSDYQMGTNDNSFLTKLNQMPAADTQEAYLRTLGALQTDYSLGIEQSIIQMAKVWLDFAPQVYTTERIITKFGVDMAADAIDFDPNSLIPKPAEYPDSPYEAIYPGCSQAERLQKHMRKFSIYASPNSLQERMSQTNKLVLLTLQKVGVPISSRKIYDVFIDDGQFENTQAEFYQEQVQKAMMAAMLQRQLAAANQQADPSNQLAQGIANVVNQGNGGNPQEGRPNTFQKPPTMQQKTDQSGVPRTTVATS